MLKLGQQFSFVQNRVDAFLCDNFCFIHFFHCIGLSISFHNNAPNFSETSFSNDIVKLEVASSNFKRLLIFAAFLYNNFVFALLMPRQLGEVDFEATLGLPARLLAQGRVAAGVILFYFLLRRRYFFLGARDFLLPGHP